MLPDHPGFYIFNEAEPHNESDIVDNFQSHLAIVIFFPQAWACLYAQLAFAGI